MWIDGLLAKISRPSRTQTLQALGLSLAVLALGILLLPDLFMHGHQKFTDIIAGDVAQEGYYKTGDLYFVFTLATLTFASFALFVLYRTFTSSSPKEPFPNLKGKADLLLPATRDSFFIYFALTGLLCLLASLAGSFRLPFWAHPLLLLGSIALAVAIQGKPEWLRFLPYARLQLPFLLLRFLRLDIRNAPAETQISVAPNALFQGLLGVTLALCLFLVYRQVILRKKRSSLPLEVALIAAFASYHLPAASPMQLDSYHTGEMLIPFQQIFQMGQRADFDFVSVHGYLAVFHGFIHWLFFDGTYATVPAAFALVDSLFAAGMAFALCASLSSDLALLLALFILPSWNRFYCFPLLLGILCSPRLWRQGLVWFALAIPLGVIALLFDHAPGLGMVLALLPWLLWRYLDLPRSHKIWAALDGGFTLLVFSSAIAGSLLFIRDNGEGTLEAFGIVIRRVHSLPSVLRSLPFLRDHQEFFGEAFKSFKLYGWMVGCLLMLAYSYRRGIRKGPRLFACAFTLIFCCALIPYSFGRIGTEGLDRVGSLTVIVLGTALPFLILIGRRRLTPALGALLVFALFLRSFHYLKDYSPPTALASAPALTPYAALEADPAHIDAPKRLGNSLVSSRDWTEQADFTRLLRKYLKSPDSRYLDLANHQAMFFIHDQESAYLYPSHLLSINQRIQSKVIERLEHRPPDFVLVAPFQVHSHFKASLRSYRIYRWLIENGYTSVRKSDLGIYSVLMKGNETADGDLRAAFFNEELGLLPHGWGWSWPLLEKRFREQATVAPSQTDSLVTLHPPKLEGRWADFLLVELAVKEENVPVKITFVADGRTFESSRFFAQGLDGNPARYLIPLGADPSWLTAHNITSIELRFPEGQSPVQIGQRAQLLRLDY